ncbi:hypothetical protein Cpap_0333 [Ruminiclostridium papyrosolvens DSM 2782]|uniref:DUF4330 domain-containing protein n=1 Tax=Ruminiclostridium papyrosolvens DSM 2782 TaxID=588581 RepID=F1TGR3_9FIRM|nr:DUF4330 domain-containing protein [Ruminiclostridium papyrosolvens]EGD46394.1 hypothetical protein Cpap_0333 [Ruminiclostridium papyrosolvens DSM 2782]WES33993.1 DUF4330 domain-containing protein [Ruminiclostridium papyrosolvens DSM 2782]
MKLIDEKGRLFGKVNIIDLVVVLLVLLLVAAVGYKVLSPKIASSPTAKGEVTAVIKCTFRTDTVISQVKAGQQLVFGTDYVPDATISEVNAVVSDYTTTDAQGRVHMEKHPTLKDLYITIKAKVNTNAAILKVGTQDLCLGKKFTVKTQTIEMDGNVEKITITK